MATYLASSHDPWVVAASLIMASFASYVALDLAKRVRSHDRRVALAWRGIGSLAMGTGVWSMHFIGMLAFRLPPLALGYTHTMTALSWLAAVLASAVALSVASRGQLTRARLAGGALAMGAGICAMHYLGMAALDMAPGIVWNAVLVAASVLVAVAASAAALSIFFWLRSHGAGRELRYQAAAALLMGLAICGLHYTAMAAASFPLGSVCLSAGGLGGGTLGTLVVLASFGLLSLTLATSVLDARMQAGTTHLAESLLAANTQLKAANDELQRHAFRDGLTGLPNRQWFEDRLKQALMRCDRDRASGAAGRTPRRLAVMFIDLDGFKPVNDSLGHAAGDQLLCEAARRLVHEAREADTVARVGGDEFLLLMDDLPDPQACVALARRLLDSLALPFEAAGRQVVVSASIGIVVYPDNSTRERLVAHADAAMYAAKRAGGAGFQMFAPHMDAGALEQLSLHHDLRHALERGELELHYQPKVDARRGTIRGVEALLRWKHPQRGMVSPALFIPIAERFGLINALGAWVIDEACRQMQAWADAGLRLHVAVNVSVHQLREADLVGRIERALRRHGVDASHLLCEITESVAMDDLQTTQRTFEGLARLGVFLSIDDFGTGHSCLASLRQLHASQLKIDRSFVADLDSSDEARTIIDAVVYLAHALDLNVVAEGVETALQRDLLIKLGCDELQGYFFARPMPAAQVLDWVQGRKPPGSADFSPSVLLDLAA